MMDPKEYGLNYRNLLRLDEVKRWHTITVAREQTVAGHSFRVAMLAIQIARSLKIETYDVLLPALMHDAGEDLLCDPTPLAKAFCPSLTQVENDLRSGLDPWFRSGTEHMIHSQIIVKCADALEAWMFLRENAVGDHSKDAINHLAMHLDGLLDKAEGHLAGIKDVVMSIVYVHEIGGLKSETIRNP